MQPVFGPIQKVFFRYFFGDFIAAIRPTYYFFQQLDSVTFYAFLPSGAGRGCVDFFNKLVKLFAFHFESVF